MNYFLTEEQQMIQELSAKIADEKITPVAIEYDELGKFPHDIVEILAASDLCGVYIPEEYGGLGGGMGSGSRTTGLGGVGTGRSMGLAGTGTANNFGSGSGGFGSGQGGSGGLGGAGLGKGFGGGGGEGGGQGGHGRANVQLPPQDPVMSGGLTTAEIMAVIRAHLNEIRHCYEQ
ncbi:MAG: acyl-CoA dehydrogenase family protein, partial [Eubacteriales bacterium]